MEFLWCHINPGPCPSFHPYPPAPATHAELQENHREAPKHATGFSFRFLEGLGPGKWAFQVPRCPEVAPKEKPPCWTDERPSFSTVDLDSKSCSLWMSSRGRCRSQKQVGASQATDVRPGNWTDNSNSISHRWARPAGLFHWLGASCLRNGPACYFLMCHNSPFCCSGTFWSRGG